jgi:ribosome-binding ATPase YchF (GTP1/OBG family)
MATNMTVQQQREEAAARLDRIEGKLDKLSEAVISIARAEEKIATLTSFSKQQSEMIQHLTIRIDKLEEAVISNSSTVNIINKVFWIIIAASATAIAGMFITMQ